MISTISFHPFIPHFPLALLVGGLVLLFLAHKKREFNNTGAASFNLSMGFIAALMANFSGMISVDITSRTSVEVLGHQGYSFLATVLFGFCLGWSYIRPFSRTAVLFYAACVLAMLTSIYSGYQLVF